MEIRLLTAADIAGMTAIEQACFAHPWSAASFESAFKVGHTVFFGAMVGATLAGYAGLQELYGEGAVTNVGVLPDFRRQGIGEALMCAMVRYGVEHAVESISLEVRESNAAARALYEKLGFEALGVRKEFYTAPKEDAVIMRKVL